MNNTLEICPICDSKDIVKDIIEETFSYGGQELVVPNYIVYKCGECGEAFPDKIQSKELEPTIRDFQREVDGLLTSEDIKKIRRGLGFTQDKFGEVLGGGAKAFARYENGTVTQSKPMDNLLRIIWHFPNSISIITNKSNIRMSKLGSTKTNYLINDNPEFNYQVTGIQNNFSAVGT